MSIGTISARHAASQQQASLAAGQQAVGAQQPGSDYVAASGSTGASGPAAWDDSWAKKFQDAGAPAEVIQQLTFTGANGAGEAELQQMLDQLTQEADKQLAQFVHEHPDEFEKLRGNPDVDRSMVVQIAMASNSGQLPEEQLTQMVDAAGKSQGELLFDTMVKPFAVWSLIPGYGALRLAAAPFTGGKDPLTGEHMFDTPSMAAISVLAGAGGAFTLANHAKAAMSVFKGQQMAGVAGSDAAKVAANEGYANLTTGQKLASYLPGTQSNKVFSGLGRFDDDFARGVEKLSGTEREVAENVLSKWRNGEMSIVGKPASKLGWMGFQPNSRGMVINGGASMVERTTVGSKPALALDARMTGPTLPAHIAAAGVDFADDGLKAKLLAEAGMPGAAGAGQLPGEISTALRQHVLGTASKQLLDAGAIARPEGFSKLAGWLRAGALEDSMKAIDELGTTTAKAGKVHGFSGMGKLAKGAVLAPVVGGLGYQMMVREPKQQAAEAEAQAAEQQKQAGKQGGGAGAAGGQPSAELEAALQQFAALPAEQQAAYIQEQYAALEQASQQPNLTAEQQGQIVSASQELELFMQVAQGSSATAAPTAAPMAPAPAAAPATAVPAGGQFTAQGLGL